MYVSRDIFEEKSEYLIVWYTIRLYISYGVNMLKLLKVIFF